MSGDTQRFLPESLRPPVAGRRSRRGFALLTVVPVILLAFPRWQVRDVRVDSCPNLPATAVNSLHELVGQPALGLDVTAIRDAVEVWPGVGEVTVELELPGTVHVRAESTPICGSVRVGRNWHGVGADGRLAGRVEISAPPILKGFDGEVERARALAVARRLDEASGGRVMEIRRVTPADYRVQLAADARDGLLAIHVDPQGSAAEKAWCAAIAKGSPMRQWADLRWPDRMVIGGAQ